MVAFNVCSVILYVVIALICNEDFFLKKTLAWIRAFYFEIVIHAFISTIYLGMDTYFFLYTLVTIPVVMYYLFLNCGGKVFAHWMIAFVSTSMLILVANYVIDKYYEPIFITSTRALTEGEKSLICAMNLFFNFFILLAFSGLFILEIHILIEKLNRTNDHLNYTATHDALTGLYNRYNLNGKLNELKKSSEPFCLVMGDIDDFKKVNDTYGHECGDLVLKSVADTIMKNLSKDDIACRWGGEEILLIMPGKEEDCLPVVSKIREEINSLNLDYEHKTVKVSMTFGFAANGDENADIDTLLNVVDKRLYKGKGSGKNVIIVE